MGKKLYIKGDADSGHHPLNMSFSPPHKFCGTINAHTYSLGGGLNSFIEAYNFIIEGFTSYSSSPGLIYL